ncbi:tetratricopeptide repeat protein [Thermodesulfobacteriota bacterium]
MTQNQRKKYRPAPQFLVGKTEAKISSEKTEEIPFSGEDLLVKVFPEILSGQNFLDAAIKNLESVSKFGVLIVRIDNPGEVSEEALLAQLIEGVGRVIDAFCSDRKGFWGGLDHGVFGCFFPGADPTSCSQFAETIQKELAQRRKETLSIGVATYPTKNYQKTQILENARKALDHAAFFGPNSIVSFDAVSLNISGDRFYQEGDIQKAVAEFKMALMLDATNVNVYNSLGVCYGVTGDFNQALENFETAIWLDPSEVMAIYNTGLVYVLMDRKDKALEYFLEAHRIDEEVFEVTFQIGRLYLDGGEPVEAIAFLERANTMQPSSGPAARYLGDCLVALNKQRDGVSAFEKAIKINPNDAAALSGLGYLFDALGENAEIALMFCEKSVEIAPDNGLYRNRLGRVYIKENRTEDALDQFQKATELGHDSTEFIEQIQDDSKEDVKN